MLYKKMKKAAYMTLHEIAYNTALHTMSFCSNNKPVSSASN